MKFKAEHTDKVAELQREIDNRKRRLDTKSNSAKDSDSTDGRMEPENTTTQETVENIENVAWSGTPVECCTVRKKELNPQYERTTGHETIQLRSQWKLTRTNEQRTANRRSQSDGTQIFGVRRKIRKYRCTKCDTDRRTFGKK